MTIQAKPPYEELERRIQELEKAESELVLAKDHLKKIFDNAQDAIFIHDLDGKIVEVNDKMCRMYGLTKEEALEVTIEDVSSPRMSKGALLKRWQKVLRDENLTFEWEARRPKDKSVFDVEVSIRKISFHDKDFVLANVGDITERKQAETYREMGHEILRILNEPGGLQETIHCIIATLKTVTGVDAVGLRLQEGEDFPYFAQDGFSKDFLLSENTLIKRGKDGGVCRDEDGNICLECTCGLVISGKTDPSNPLFTQRGSCWTNDSLPLLELPEDQEPRLQARNNCIHRGYASVALIPVRIREKIVGLIQLNDRRKDRFTLETIEMLEGIAAHIGSALMRKRAEEALREREEKYRLLFNMGVNAMFLVDNTTTQILECNTKASRLFGYSSQKLLSMKMTDLSTTPEATRLACQKHVARRERVYRKEDGELLAVEITSQHFYLADRAVHLAAIRDITDIKHAQKALEESEERFRTLMENIDAIAVQGYGPDGTTQYWNAASERLYGYSRDEAIGRNLLDLIIPSEMKGAVAKEMREMAESGRPAPSEELLLMHKDGSRVPVITHHAIVKVPGRAQELFCLDVDISARKQAEAEKEKLKTQLNQAQKMESVGRLAGGVAHDFNNMLSVILGHTEIILDDLDPATQLFADLQAVHQAAKRSATLTRQLLTFARKQTIAPKVINLNDTVEGMLKMLRRLIGEDIDLTWLPGKKLAPVKVDPSQIDQILANLCVNSRDAIADVGKITIESGVVSFDEAYCSVHAGFVPGDYVLLAVSDNGCGMDRETISHLFEPFFTTKEPGKGTGLGLASVYGAVKQNNGFINVTSEPGRGTTFRIYLPQHQAKTSIQTDKARAKPSAGRSETILLVEDEPAILRMTTKMLKSLGYVVIAANAPAEAIRLAREHIGAIDLLMTDVVMPEMNGRDLAVNLLSTNPDIKRLFMSGYTANVIAHHGVLDEGVHFIQKPFSSKDLGAKLRGILEDKSAD